MKKFSPVVAILTQNVWQRESMPWGGGEQLSVLPQEVIFNDLRNRNRNRNSSKRTKTWVSSTAPSGNYQVDRPTFYNDNHKSQIIIFGSFTINIEYSLHHEHFITLDAMESSLIGPHKMSMRK